jgi:hypothetical protein
VERTARGSVETGMNAFVLQNPPPFHSTQRIPELLCQIMVEGVSLEGRPIELRGRSLWIILPAPLFARPDSTIVVVVGQSDGSSVKIAGRVTCQQQIDVGEVLVAIQLADPPDEVTAALLESHAFPLTHLLDREPRQYPQMTRLLDWVRILAGYPIAAFQDQRLIPRLAIHTTCTIFTNDMIRTGVTQDLSYTGFSVRFSDFSPDCLWGALFYIKFVKLKARPIGIAHQGRYTVVRFRVESIQEGENRWLDLHYSYWQHLS